MEHVDVTRALIGCADTVYNTLGAGFMESVYERSPAIELRKAEMDVARQRAIPVFYDKQLVGDFKADLMVNDLVIVELKAVQSLTRVHEVQLVNYLTATHKAVGLLLNFGTTDVQIKRKVLQLPTDLASGRSA